MKLTSTNCSIGLIVKAHAWRTVCYQTVQHTDYDSRIYVVFAGPVVMAGSFHSIPSRTRSLNSPALMVLRLKAWESKSLPNLIRSTISLLIDKNTHGAGWSSPVARQAHNLKVVGSNPTPATKITNFIIEVILHYHPTMIL